MCQVYSNADHTETNRKSLGAYILVIVLYLSFMQVFGFKEACTSYQAVCGFKRKMQVLFCRTSHYQYFIFHEKEKIFCEERKESTLSGLCLQTGKSLNHPGDVSQKKGQIIPHITCNIFLYLIISL